MAILARKGGSNISPIFGPPDSIPQQPKKTTSTCKQIVHQQQSQQQQQQQQRQQEQEQEQSQVTESKRHRTKTMKNQYLSRGSGGPGQWCSDSSKNTQPQFVFSGDFGPEGGSNISLIFGPPEPIPKRPKNDSNNNNNKNKNKNKAKSLNQRGVGPRPWRTTTSTRIPEAQARDVLTFKEYSAAICF